ncbi:MAG: sulfurtransferase TusA family protein [Thermoproteota archaeon]|jgi:tRNA 2-thiouridine synthesizing protein A|nr:sulfurtransferase TusA family protein [Thermoproteota archaeon]
MILHNFNWFVTMTDLATKSIDVRGLYCPEPVFRTKMEVERLKIGDTLKIVADDPESEEDISRWVNRNGHQLISLNKNDKDLEFVIKKAK